MFENSINIGYSQFGKKEELLARMLCYGVRAETSLKLKLARTYSLDSGFIHGTIWDVQGNYINTAFVDSMTRSSLAVKLIERDDRLLAISGDYHFTCKPIPQPRTISNKWPNYGEIGQFIRLHGPRTLFATPVRECIFGAIGKECTFCTYDMDKPRPVPPDIFVEMLHIVIDEVGTDIELAIGAGTPNLADHGVHYFSELVRKVRKVFNIPISVELVPPRNVEELEELVEAGADSLIMSLELWDEEIKKRECPGKSVIDKSHYISAWEKGIGLLGLGQVSSVLLVGLEPEERTRQGIDNLVRIGVIPTIIPFRPYDASKLSDHQLTDHNQFLRCAAYCANKLVLAKLNPTNQSGCTKCGACSFFAKLAVAYIDTVLKH